MYFSLIAPEFVWLFFLKLVFLIKFRLPFSQKKKKYLTLVRDKNHGSKSIMRECFGG